VGAPEIRLIDALAGATVARLAMAEHRGKTREILLDQSTVTLLQIPAREWRGAETANDFWSLISLLQRRTGFPTRYSLL